MNSILPELLRDAPLVAILVIFDPHSDPLPLLAQLRPWVRRVVVVDNNPQAHPASTALQAWPDVVVLHNANQGGLAGAYNAALRALAEDADWKLAVFLDEDSDVAALAPFLADAATGAVLAQATTAAVAPVYRERATGLRGAHLQLGRFSLGHLPREQRGITPVAFIINSMSVWRRAALQRIGGYNEGLAVDHVDTEYCLRARQAGLALFIHGDHEFAHSIGQRHRYRLLGRTLQSGGHGPARRYQIGRNTTWLMCHYLIDWPAFSLLCLLRLGYEAVGIICAERQRQAKLLALTRGVLRGLCSRYPAPEPRSGLPESAQQGR